MEENNGSIKLIIIVLKFYSIDKTPLLILILMIFYKTWYLNFFLK